VKYYYGHDTLYRSGADEITFECHNITTGHWVLLAPISSGFKNAYPQRRREQYRNIEALLERHSDDPDAIRYITTVLI